MSKTTRKLLVHKIAATGLAISLTLSGCATLAHRSSYEYPGKRLVQQCENKGDICPWLASDFLLLLAGGVPGVIALGVDFGTGAWKHEHYADSHF